MTSTCFSLLHHPPKWLPVPVHKFLRLYEPYLPTSYRSPSCDVNSGAVYFQPAPGNNGKADSSFWVQRTDSRIRQNKDKTRSHRRLCERSLLNRSLRSGLRQTSL